MNLRDIKPDPIQDEIDSLITQMRAFPPESDEYATIAARVKDLCEAKRTLKQAGVSMDTKAQIAANLIGIFAVLHYEKLNVIASKAFGMVAKLHV